VRQRNDMGWSAFSARSTIVTTSTVRHPYLGPYRGPYLLGPVMRLTAHHTAPPLIPPLYAPAPQVLPPETPSAILVNTNDAIVQWAQSANQTFIDFKIQIGALPPIFATRLHRAARRGGDDDDDKEDDADEERRMAYAELLWRPAHARVLMGEEAIGISKATAAGGKSERDPATGLRGDGSGRVITQALVTQLSQGSLWAVRVKVRTVAGWSSWSAPSDPFRTSSAP